MINYKGGQENKRFLELLVVMTNRAHNYKPQSYCDSRTVKGTILLVTTQNMWAQKFTSW